MLQSFITGHEQTQSHRAADFLFFGNSLLPENLTFQNDFSMIQKYCMKVNRFSIDSILS